MTEKKTKSTALVVKGHLEKNRNALSKILPKGCNYDRLCRVLMNAVSTNETLAKCTPVSIFLSCIKGFALGLEVNGALNMAYLIPYKNRLGIYEAQFMPSYLGLIELARRSGEISSICANPVYERDEITVQEGSERIFVHKPDIFQADRGKIIGYYAIYHNKDGSFDYEIMDMKELDKIRRSSKTSNNGPWVDWEGEMYKKSVLKRLLKRAPKSVELAKAIDLDHKAAMGEKQSKDLDFIDIDGLDLSDDSKKSKFENIPPIKEPATDNNLFSGKGGKS